MLLKIFRKNSDSPMEKVLAQLPLTQDISKAILEKSGVAGEALQFAIDYERWELKDGGFRDVGTQQLAGIYLASINWSNNVLGSI